jgi:hypothetical protein
VPSLPGSVKAGHWAFTHQTGRDPSAGQAAVLSHEKEHLFQEALRQFTEKQLGNF